MVRAFLTALCLCALALAGCKRPDSDSGVRATPLKKEDPRKPREPRPPGPPRADDSAPAAAEDDEPAVPSIGVEPPSKDEGQKAFNLGKALLRDGDFKGAEEQLKVASAAGLEGADKLLLRARNEAKGEEAFLSARKKMDEKDYPGAKQDLQQVPPNTVTATKAKALVAEINGMEASEVKEMRQNASERLGLVDGGAAAKPEETPPDAAAPPPPPEPPKVEGAGPDAGAPDASLAKKPATTKPNKKKR
ncbi:MAG TPA: hypothetical protein VGK67_10495 [Myxococcales bacterium]